MVRRRFLLEPEPEPEPECEFGPCLISPQRFSLTSIRRWETCVLEEDEALDLDEPLERLDEPLGRGDGDFAEDGDGLPFEANLDFNPDLKRRIFFDFFRLKADFEEVADLYGKVFIIDFKGNLET